MRALAAQFMGFVAVGMFGFVAHYGLLGLLVELAGMPAVPASALGFVAGGLVNYTLGRRFVFRSDRSHAGALPRFFAVALSGLAINTLMMALLVTGLGLHYLAAQVLTTGTLVVWHFLANRFWTFRDAPG